jgi:hypothetical protein
VAKSKPFIIDDETAPKLVDLLNPPGFGHGYDPLQKAANPMPMLAPPDQIKLIPRGEWSERIKERKRQKATGRDLKARMNGGKKHVSLDQNGQGYCWAYSTGAAVMLTRMAANLPVVRVSPHAVACKIKGFRDEGGWCGLSAKFAREVGYPSVDVWPEKSMSRQNDRPETWADAAKHKIEEDWVDLAAGHFYYQNLTFDQVATCVLLNRACPVDFNWWQHSVCAVGLVRVEPGSYGLRILNSWSENWGEQGFATLRGNKATPNSALCVRTVTT